MRLALLPRLLFLLTTFFSGALAFAAQPPTAQDTPKVAVTVRAHQEAIKPGSVAVLAVTLDHQPSWHTQSHSPTVDGLIPTTITVKGEGITQGTIQWPKLHTIKLDINGDGKPIDVEVFEGKATAFVPLTIAGNPGDARSAEVRVGWQVCDDTTCLMPTSQKFTLNFTLDPNAATKPFGDLFAGYQPGAAPPSASSATSTAPSPTPSKTISFNVFGYTFDVTATGMGFLVLLLLAFIGGAILNLTPCVLPVIPLKILSLTKAAGSQSRSTALGIAMSLGIVTFWLALGLIIAASTSFKSASQLFGYWWFTLGMGLFIFFMGMGSMGLFNVGLPNWAYSLNPRLDSLRGSFFFGIVTAILGTPCIAPFMGGAIGWAVFQPTLTVLAVFTAVGLGMAAPYLLLAMKPAWLSRLPKAGPGGDLLKQVLGLLLIAVSVFFIGIGLRTLTKQHPHLAGVLHWWIIAAVMIAAALWLSLRGLAINKRPLGKALIVALSALLAAAPILWARAQTRSASYADLWRHYTPQALAAARAANKTIVLDFTADWCANCKTLKAGVLDREAVRSVLAEKDVAAFEVDLTVTDETTDAWRLLKSYSRIAPPLLVIEGPGSADSFQSDAYTVANVLDALARRRRLAGGSKIGG